VIGDGRVSRLLSTIVLLFYLVTAYTSGGVDLSLRVLLLSIVPIACIWFPEPLGDYTGLFLGDSITNTSPAGLVWFLGWLVLLLPMLLAVLLWLQGVRTS